MLACLRACSTPGSYADVLKDTITCLMYIYHTQRVVDILTNLTGPMLNLAERTLWCLETLKQGGAWTILLYTVVADWSWAASPQQKDDLRNHLTVDKAMLQSHLQRLERFFPNVCILPIVVITLVFFFNLSLIVTSAFFISLDRCCAAPMIAAMSCRMFAMMFAASVLLCQL